MDILKTHLNTFFVDSIEKGFVCVCGFGAFNLIKIISNKNKARVLSIILKYH